MCTDMRDSTQRAHNVSMNLTASTVAISCKTSGVKTCTQSICAWRCLTQGVALAGSAVVSKRTASTILQQVISSVVE
jgi:hypothetical protein